MAQHSDIVAHASACCLRLQSTVRWRTEGRRGTLQRAPRYCRACHPLILCALLAPVSRGAALQEVLGRAANAAVQEAAVLSSLACTEKVVETKFDQKEKLEEQRRHVFDYLVMIDTSDGEIEVTESRMEQAAPKKQDHALLASTGFATMMLILHPYFQYSFRFTDGGVQEDSGRNWRKILFEFQPGKRSPSVLRVSDREYPLGWQGEILVDETTGRAGLVRAHLGAKLEDIGLQSLITEVRYGPAEAGSGISDWVPTAATVDLRTKARHWRNMHTFSTYRRFEVTTVERQERKAVE
jgi:hypothetical protein